MIGAAPPRCDDAANYAHVARVRLGEGSRLPTTLESSVLARYQQYGGHIASGSAPVPHGFPPAHHEALKGNYDYLSRAYFNDLRGEILAAAGGRCPYCHQHKANEIDHFLPKANFGEYSIFSQNLVPICTACNKKKSNRFKTPQAGRRYVHPYFDILPSDRFLHADLAVGSTVTIQFSVVRSPGMPAETAARLQTQFDDLGLKIRYGEEATGEMLSRLGALYVYWKSGGSAEVARYLEVDHRSMASHLGVNHWRSVTLSTLAASQAFCDGGFGALGPDPML